MGVHNINGFGPSSSASSLESNSGTQQKSSISCTACCCCIGAILLIAGGATYGVANAACNDPERMDMCDFQKLDNGKITMIVGGALMGLASCCSVLACLLLCGRVAAVAATDK